MATVGLVTLFVGTAPAVASTTECPDGTSHSVNQNQVVVGAEHCHPAPNRPRVPNSPHNDPHDGDQYVDDRDGAADVATVDQPSGPTRHTVSEEEYLRRFDLCRRGPNRDNLSIACVAALPDREGPPADPADPADPAAPAVTVEQVRESAIAQIDMGAPELGASPCLAAADACRGTVGVPVWLWVGDGTGSLPSESATATAGPYTITATAKVSKVKWSLGDGQSVACHGVGTKYDPERDGWSAPTCGFDAGWKQAGTYTLTASYVWEISWSGDAAGSTTQTLSSTEQITVGELQSVATTG